MIPAIGLIIGVYVMLRFCEVFASAPARYASPEAHGVMKVLAGLAILVVLALLWDVIHSSL